MTFGDIMFDEVINPPKYDRKEPKDEETFKFSRTTFSERSNELNLLRWKLVVCFCVVWNFIVVEYLYPLKINLR